MACKKSTSAMELGIGATIIAGVVILVVMLMAWGNSTSLLGRHYRVMVNMTNVGGLKEGAPVKMGGFQIGRVAVIRIKPGTTDMEIVLDIDENRILPRGSTAKVSTAGLVGDAFMEIVPGKSSETIRRATTTADAEHIGSSPLPDMSEMMAKMSAFGDQLNILTQNLNAVVGDLQFQKSIKSMAANIDNVSYQAGQILLRGHTVIDNVEQAAKNVSELTANMNTLIANPEIAKNIADTTANISAVTTKIKAITDGLNPAEIEKSYAALTAGIASMAEVVEKVKAEPVLALSINKASDRIVKMKFDELARQGVTTSDATLRAINGWVGQSMNAGVFEDPSYEYEGRPYALEEMKATGASATEKRPYITD